MLVTLYHYINVHVASLSFTILYVCAQLYNIKLMESVPVAITLRLTNLHCNISTMMMNLITNIATH